MTHNLRAQERLRLAAGLAAVLDAAYDAFEEMLQAVRAQEDPGSSLFSAFVMAAASAADGRDAILFAPSLSQGQSTDASEAEREALAGEDADTVADAVAGLSHLLAARLDQVGESASDHGDRVACRDARRCAEQVYSLLCRSGP